MRCLVRWSGPLRVLRHLDDRGAFRKAEGFEKNSETGRAPLNYGIGVHVGDVMYGNIGSRTRLDFTVIGPAVNMASRLEALTKQLGRTVLLSRAFADFVESDFDLERIGEYPVRGFNDPIELFAYHG
jgi:adenylate cyclase